MQEQFKVVFERFKDTWSKIGLNQKISIILATGAVIVGFVSLMLLSSKSTDMSIASGISDQEAARITAILDEEKIPHKISARGNEITVTKKNYHKARMKLALKGVADTGGKGYRVFDEAQFGRSDYVQRLQHQVALQQELEMTINELEEVDSVRVHVVPPKRSLLVDPNSQPKASVLIKKASMDLPRNSIKAIQNLVAHAVDGLTASNVTVVDEQGTLLSRDMDDTNLMAVENQLKAKSEYEKYLTGKAQNLLDTFLGHGKSKVAVNAFLTADNVEEVSKTYNPTNSVVLSKTIQEQYEQTADGEGGVPGVPTNSPGDTNSVAIPPGFNSTTNIIKDLQYGNDEKMTTIVKTPGVMTNVTASVVLDTQYMEDPSGVMVPKHHDSKVLEDLTKVVMASLGIKDIENIALIQMPFVQNDTTVFGQMQKMDQQMFYFDLVKQILYFVLPLAFFFGFVRMWKKSSPDIIPIGVPVGEAKMESQDKAVEEETAETETTSEESKEEEEPNKEETVQNEEQSGETLDVTTNEEVAPEPQPDYELDIPFTEEELMAGLSDAEREDMQRKVRNINNWIHGKPETAVRTVRNWLDQEDSEVEEVLEED